MVSPSAPPPLTFYIGELPWKGGDGMKLVTQRELEVLTGRHRKFLVEVLQGVPFKPGPNRAHLFESNVALDTIYAVSRSLDEARTKQAEATARLNSIRADCLSKTRIPLHIVEEIMDEIFQSIGATLKNEASKGRPLTREIVNSMFEKFRNAPKQLKW
jgi:hypothetical protein